MVLTCRRIFSELLAGKNSAVREQRSSHGDRVKLKDTEDEMQKSQIVAITFIHNTGEQGMGLSGAGTAKIPDYFSSPGKRPLSVLGCTGVRVLGRYGFLNISFKRNTPNITRVRNFNPSGFTFDLIPNFSTADVYRVYWVYRGIEQRGGGPPLVLLPCGRYRNRSLLRLK